MLVNRRCVDVETRDEALFLMALDHELHRGREFDVDYVSFYEGDPEDLPEWLKKAWWYANENVCTLMMFDRDAIKLDELPKWDW